MERAGTAAGAGRRLRRRPLTRSLLLALGLLLAGAAPAAAAPSLVKLGDFDRPVYVASPPADGHLFVVEKGGTIRLVGGGTFLDISSQVNGSQEERGLLSMAFSPSYASNGLFYVFFTDTEGDIRIVEYRRSANPLVADPASRRPIFFAEHSDAEYHNGGQLQFGPDGMLYASIGDNESPNNAQNTSVPYGKIIRINPGTGAWSTWSYGLRNPWRFSFDRGTSDIAIGDVGASSWEEIDWGAAPNRAAGVNFGWPESEGFGPFGTDPIVAHSHGGDGFCAIVGGYVVRDPGLPTLRGRYIYGDNCNTSLWTTTPRTGAGDEDPLPGLSVPATSSFGEDACGHIYVASLAGPVYRLQDGAVSACTLGGGGGGGTTSDTTAPTLKVGLAGVRKLLKTRRLRVGVRCNEACRVTVGTRLRHVRKLKRRHRSLAANQRKVVRIKLRRAVVRKLRKRVHRRGFVRIAVTVRATDAAGNVAKKTRHGRVNRRR